jgi:1-acyl-sn-glycerol-3-phosphate acyltransferase
MLRSTLRTLVRPLFWLLTRVTACGVEHIPAQGGCILATNHLSRFDIPLIYIQIERDDLSALVAKKYLRYPGIRWLVDQIEGIWIDRQAADIAAVRAARDYVQGGGMLGIAPEGTRSPDHSLLPAKPGVAFLAAKVGAPIVPVAVSGTEKIVPSWRRLQRPRLTVRFGEPFTLPPLDRRAREASLQRNTDEIMCRIAALLPPEYRGTYQDHPRVAELARDLPKC